MCDIQLFGAMDVGNKLGCIAETSPGTWTVQSYMCGIRNENELAFHRPASKDHTEHVALDVRGSVVVPAPSVLYHANGPFAPLCSSKNISMRAFRVCVMTLFPSDAPTFVDTSTGRTVDTTTDPFHSLASFPLSAMILPCPPMFAIALVTPPGHGRRHIVLPGQDHAGTMGHVRVSVLAMISATKDLWNIIQTTLLAAFDNMERTLRFGLLAAPSAAEPVRGNESNPRARTDTDARRKSELRRNTRCESDRNHDPRREASAKTERGDGIAGDSHDDDNDGNNNSHNIKSTNIIIIIIIKFEFIDKQKSI